MLTQPRNMSVVRSAVVPSVMQRRVFRFERCVLLEQATMFSLQLVHAHQCNAFRRPFLDCDVFRWPV